MSKRGFSLYITGKGRFFYIVDTLEVEYMSSPNQFLGIVRKAKAPSTGLQLQLLIPDSQFGRFRKLTDIQMQEARPPEAGELDLTEYEGKVIMINGQDGGRWIYSASIIDAAGPILTAVVNKVFKEILSPQKPSK